MPKRQTLVKADSSQVQGEGSYVTYKEPTVEEMRDFRSDLAKITERVEQMQKEGTVVTEEFNKLAQEAEQMNFAFLARYIMDWNWVEDDAGEIPMPKPHDNPDLFFELTPTEMQFLGELFNISIKKKKH